MQLKRPRNIDGVWRWASLDEDRSESALSDFLRLHPPWKLWGWQFTTAQPVSLFVVMGTK